MGIRPGASRPKDFGFSTIKPASGAGAVLSGVFWLTLFVTPVLAQDLQVVPVGNGAANKACVNPGPDSQLDSTAGGDDVAVGPIGTNNIVHTGPNGICQTPLSDDDVYASGVVFGGGSPFQTVISAGTSGSNNGICDSIAAAAGDDVLLAGPGQSTPRWVGIRPGGNGILDSLVAGDDIATTGICAGTNNVFDSNPTAGDDVNVASDTRCNLLGCASLSCILPGVDLVLQTAVAGDDVAKPYISTGANGILDTTVVSDDDKPSVIGGTGQGLQNATCVDSGADGIVQTALCGAGATPDIGEQCDTGGESPTCDADCTFVTCGDGTANATAGESCDTSGESATCDDDCTAVGCGDSNVNQAAGETCDDGNTSSNDGCNAACIAEVCGDGIVQGGIGETCDLNGEAPSCDDDCTAVACGDSNVNQAAGEICDDGNTSSNDGCDSSCIAEVCGDGIIQTGIGETCDDAGANSDTAPDACRTNCSLPSCGDGVIDPGNTEECDDGNIKNNDDCLLALGCLDARCGDGFRHTKGTPPFEECDDGNTTAGDGCDGTCAQEPAPGCGNGNVDTLCTAGTIGSNCTQNADCDVTPGDGVCTAEECDDANNSGRDDCLNNCVAASCGDGIAKSRGTAPLEECDDGNTQGGDGCSSTCEQECGNAQIDGACSQGAVGSYCQTNADCDVSPGDGICVTEECDPGIDGLCDATPPTCSNQCTIASCGNGVLECNEQCDLAALNGVAGSGCTALCSRNVIGPKELTGILECPAAWTLDNPPQSTSSHFQRCQDGAACDFDAAADGKCTFSVGICLNRPQPVACTQSPIIALELLHLRVEDPVQAAVAETMTDALATLTSESAEMPGRCSRGLRRKNCSVATDCDSYLGAHDGICNVATGVAYVPELTALGLSPNQTTACTSGEPVVVPVGVNLRLRLYAHRDASVRSDKDTLRLSCED